MNGSEPAVERQRPVADSHADLPLPEPDGPVDPTVSTLPNEGGAAARPVHPDGSRLDAANAAGHPGTRAVLDVTPGRR
jgi:hypothetical protein